MSQSNKPVALALGAVAAGTLLAGSLFSMQAMAHGYMQDAATPPAKTAEGKCGEGKCGGDQATAKSGGASVGKANPGKRDSASGQATGKRKHPSMADMDIDKDGRMSRAEFNVAHENKTMAHDDWLQRVAKQFAGHDGDGDGFITQAEMDAHHAAMKVSKESHGKATAEGKCGEGKCGGKP